jgi:8-oxo-dGTP pyrophosphatase MutT (NUDIX family)
VRVAEAPEEIDGETVFEGQIFNVRRARYRHADGEEVAREVVVHGGAAAVVAYDERSVYLVRQPREAIERGDLLELPAGRLDVEGEPPLATAQRELAEEIGMTAQAWQHATTYFSSAGFTNEEVTIYLATGLQEVGVPEDAPEERIEVVPWPLDELDAAIDATVDAKTLIGLLWLRRAREAGGGGGTG